MRKEFLIPFACFMIAFLPVPVCFADNSNGKENIRYSTSSSPTGPWQYRGIIMPTEGLNRVRPCTSWTNHPGVVDYKGGSYFVYHNAGLPNSGTKGFNRSVCVEKFTYNADGTIPTIHMTLAGPPQIGTLNPYDTVQAETICWSSGLRTRVCSEGGMCVDSIHNGDYIKVKDVNFGSGANSFMAQVASATNGGNIELRLDTTIGPLLGTCAVTGTGGWQTWATRTCTVTGATGVHDLYLRFTGGSGMLFHFNWWKFAPTVGVNDGAGPMFPNHDALTAMITGGKTRTLRLDFAQPVVKGNLKVCLFDVQGRLVATLIQGRPSAPHLMIPIKAGCARSGACVIRISLNDTIVMTKTFLLPREQI